MTRCRDFFVNFPVLSLRYGPMPLNMSLDSVNISYCHGERVSEGGQSAAGESNSLIKLSNTKQQEFVVFFCLRDLYK